MKDEMMIPTREEIDGLLTYAKEVNDGPWIDHCRIAGQAACLIASAIPTMDEELAYACGCLHDIGRLEGFSYNHHAIHGYHVMSEKGYPLIARICLTHSFPGKHIHEFSGKNDCTQEENEWLTDYLDNTSYDDYDKLIQLCDAIALPSGFCIVQERLVDVTLRHGFNEYTLEKWKAYLNLVDYFSEKVGRSIYQILKLR